MEPLRNTLLRQPGILSISGAAFLPYKTGGEIRVRPDGTDERDAWAMDVFTVDYGFLETMAIGLQAGRSFSADFADEGKNRFLLNTTAVRQLGWTDPIGKPLTVGDQTGTVIGVVRDFHFRNLVFPLAPSVVRLNPDWNRYLFIKYDDPSRADSIRALIGKSWEARAPLIPFEASRLETMFAEAYGDIRKVSRMFGLIGLFTILFSSVGMLGLAAFILNAKTKEIGIRKVLGASAGRVLRQLLAEFISPVVIADIIAIVAAGLIWSRVFGLYAYSAKIPYDAFFLMALSSILVVLAAIFTKTWSAARRNPAESMKYE
jgi:putative ABC transport system permease protein